MNKTRVLLCGTHVAQNNGYSKVVYELSKRLSTYNDIDLHLFSFQKFYNNPQHEEERKLPDNVVIYDVYAHEEPKKSGFGDELIQEYVKEFKPHIVIVYNDLVVLYRLIKKLVELPPEERTFKILPYVDLVYKNEKNALIKFLEDTTDGAIMFSQYWKEVIQSQGYTKPLNVVEHGFDKMNYYPIPKEIARNYLNLDQNDFIILNLNRNQPRKRWDTCMMAFVKFISTHQNEPIKLLIGTGIEGSWDLIDIYCSECRKYGLDPEETKKHLIIMNNPQKLTDKDINVLYNCADVGLNTCDGEGWGLCNFEHGAIGVPQIIPNVGGFKDYFDIKNSFLVTPKWSYYSDMSRDIVSGEAEVCDIDDYIRMMEHAYKNKNLLEKFGKKARELILEKYKWDDKAKAFYDCIIFHTKDMPKDTESLFGKNKHKEMKLDILGSSTSTPTMTSTKLSQLKNSYNSVSMITPENDSKQASIEAQNKISIKNVEIYDGDDTKEEEPQDIETISKVTPELNVVTQTNLPNHIEPDLNNSPKHENLNELKNTTININNPLLPDKENKQNIESGPLNISSNRKTNTQKLDIIKEEPVNKKESIVMDLPIMKKEPVIKEMIEVDEGKVEQVSDRDLELDGVEESKEKTMSDEMLKLLEMQQQLNLMIQSMKS
jgi:glycosyltransferase involved in cell wall biosynthesis